MTTGTTFRVNDDSCAQARPERASASIAVANPLWIRFPDAASWCLVVAVAGSYVTACHGRIARDTDDVDPSVNPPRMCTACELAWMRRQRIERGLAELVRNAPAMTLIEFDQLEDGQ